MRSPISCTNFQHWNSRVVSGNGRARRTAASGSGKNGYGKSIQGLYVITGSVTAKSDGHAVNTGSITLEDPANQNATLRTTAIEKDGSFRFNYVPGGTYRVHVVGAADMQGAGGMDGMAAMLFSGNMPKNLKEYGEANVTLSLPGNSEALNLQVPDVVQKPAAQ